MYSISYCTTTAGSFCIKWMWVKYYTNLQPQKGFQSSSIFIKVKYNFLSFTKTNPLNFHRRDQSSHIFKLCFQIDYPFQTHWQSFKSSCLYPISIKSADCRISQVALDIQNLRAGDRLRFCDMQVCFEGLYCKGQVLNCTPRANLHRSVIDGVLKRKLSLGTFSFTFCVKIWNLMHGK